MFSTFYRTINVNSWNSMVWFLGVRSTGLLREQRTDAAVDRLGGRIAGISKARQEEVFYEKIWREYNG